MVVYLSTSPVNIACLLECQVPVPMRPDIFQGMKTPPRATCSDHISYHTYLYVHHCTYDRLNTFQGHSLTQSQWRILFKFHAAVAISSGIESSGSCPSLLYTVASLPTSLTMLPFPDENLPHLQMSVPDMVNNGIDLLGRGDIQNFCQLMLSGRYVSDDAVEHRVYVNARQGTQPPLLNDCTLTRDIDSVIGITDDLPYTAPLAIFPMAPFKETLKKSNHIATEITTANVCEVIYYSYDYF